ncbi:hypothetical protein PUNSTDRAFT_59746 [Punctularia strigosozonata HHB-11173 SS5]|uniref:uncharacterized protein n=1 Tax=Punctularia strigosozonata (strain HHB-11173) TaxID=741275 RepID=UPI0004416662|nr:uncharacterized protein PUNSTDRAFT_59746 [Punctularia strigosozonata HHB-11173 SS5]EIN13942.1 hypothetical protein PUNSTDRAFT_59746 [Punctularia strigosozonata HHB-11173 SS5]
MTVANKSWPLNIPEDDEARPEQLVFSKPAEMLQYATRNWLQNFVTVDLQAKADIQEFSIRPFFMLVHVDAPVLQRFSRLSGGTCSLEEFIHEHDYTLYGGSPHAPHSSVKAPSTLHSISGFVDLRIVNSFPSVPDFKAHLDSLGLLDPDRLRPRWDTYFMKLASLASLRSNCMKRRVGAVVVRHNRVISTGYNGTARGLRNCNAGGCSRCNSGSSSGSALDECVCLHAEENALLEAGRERVGDGSVLYCNTCPCLRCTVKIIQTGIKEVVYNLSYKVDDASLALFREADVKLRKYAPPLSEA